MKKKVSIVLLLVLLISNIAYGQVIVEDELRSYLLADYETGEILEAYNIDETVEIASISKIMTYLVVMDQVDRGRISLSDRIVIDADHMRVGGSTYNIAEGDIYTVDEMLNISLVISANNITYALARHVAGSELAFASMMNEKAREIGLEDAIFYNATGLPVHSIDDQNKMKVRDILKLSRYLIREYPDILDRTSIEYIEARHKTIYQGEEVDRIPNTSPILGIVPGADGLKTGFTNKAGYSFVGSFKKNPHQEDERELRLISIIMGGASEKRRNEIAVELMGDAYSRYSKKILYSREDLIDSIHIPDVKRRKVDLYPEEDIVKILDSSKKLEVEIELDEMMDYPIRAGESIGRLNIFEDGQLIDSRNIVSDRKLKKAGFIRRFFRKIIEILRNK